MEKKIITIMFLLLTAKFMPTSNTAAKTITMPDCTYSTVNGFINSGQTQDGKTFSAGDTIVLPPCSETWASELVITVGLTLHGNGVDSTTLSRSGSTIKYRPSDPSANQNFRVTGITFSSGYLTIENTSTTSFISNIVIDNNKFSNGRYGISIFGLVYGVVHTNTFTGTETGFDFRGIDNYSWNFSANPGSNEYLFFEDNTFISLSGCIVSNTGQGSKWVFRHNSIMATGVDYNILDIHGNLSYNAGDCSLTANNRGNVSVEIYENTITGVDSPTRFVDNRGGTNIIYNNTATGSTSTYNYCAVYLREEDNNAATGDCYPLKETHPGYDPVVNNFIWNNTYNGSAGYLENDDYQIMIVEQQDYWSDTKRYTREATTYWASGESSARNESICSDESVYWETDTNRLYRCESTDNWVLKYSPYTYPHPLRQRAAMVTGAGSFSGATFQ